MGRNKQRSRAVDVTKSLLQPTSITDHISVQIAPNHVLHIAEDELSPTQGSEAAFALRREGKLDASMKLCINWRQGGCHNHAACSFAHVTQYFGVSAELAAGGSGSVGTPGTPGRTGFSGSATSNSSLSQRTAPPLGGGGGGASNSRYDEPARLPGPAGAAPPPRAGTEAPASFGTGLVTNATAAVPQPTERLASGAARRGAAMDGEAVEDFTPRIADADAASDCDATSAPAVISAEGLRAVLASLTATLANRAADAAAASGAPAEAPAGSEEGGGTVADLLPHLEWLQTEAQQAIAKERASGGREGTFTWQAPVVQSHDDIISAVGSEMLGEPLSISARAVDIFCSFPDSGAPAAQQQAASSLRRRMPMTDSTGRPVMGAAGPRPFSTAPTQGAHAAAAAMGGRAMLASHILDMIAGDGSDDDSVETRLPHFS